MKGEREVVTLKTIKVDCLNKSKADYDIIVERGVDDLQWVGAAGTDIEVNYKGASAGLAPARSFADPHPSGNPNEKIFYAQKHSGVWVKQSRVGGGVEIEYEIVVKQGKKIVCTIDPFVKILP